MSERCNEIEGSYDKIIITIIPSYTGKIITRLLPLALLFVLHIHNNTDSNKLVIFSGIALYYGNNYILSRTATCVHTQHTQYSLANTHMIQHSNVTHLTILTFY